MGKQLRRDEESGQAEAVQGGIITEETLSGVYGIDVEVDSLNGHRLILARRHGRESGEGEARRHA